MGNYLNDLVMLIGLGLVSAGLSLVSVPAALVVPGLILIWLALPRAPRAKTDRRSG